MAKRKRKPVDAAADGELIDAAEATEDRTGGRSTRRAGNQSGATSTGGRPAKPAAGKKGAAASAAPAARTRAQQRRLDAGGQQGGNKSLLYILGGLVAAVALVGAIVGIVWAESRSDDVMENRPVEASGVALVPMPQSGPDTAVGATAPQFKGQTFTGEPVEVKYPAVVMVVAHWCGYCQKEVPAFAPIAKSWQGPVNIHLISSGVTPGQANYPPSKWIGGVGWPNPIADDVTGSATKAFGVTGFPGFIAVGADGKVRARAVGEIGEARFRQLLDLAGMSEADAKTAEAARGTAPSAPASPTGTPTPAPGAPAAPSATAAPATLAPAPAATTRQ